MSGIYKGERGCRIGEKNKTVKEAIESPGKTRAFLIPNQLLAQPILTEDITLLINYLKRHCQSNI